MLRSPETSDEDLIEAVCKASVHERERDLLHKSPKELKNPRNQVLSVSTSDNASNAATVQKSEVSKLASLVENLTKQVSVLQSDISHMKSTGMQEKCDGLGSRSRYTSRRCDNCSKFNVDYCKHCYLCGSEQHFARYCNKKKSGNQ